MEIIKNNLNSKAYIFQDTTFPKATIDRYHKTYQYIYIQYTTHYRKRQRNLGKAIDKLF